MSCDVLSVTQLITEDKMVLDFEICEQINKDLLEKIRLIHCFDDSNGSNVLVVTKDDNVYSLGSNQFGSCGVGHNKRVDSIQIVPELCKRGVKEFFIGMRFVLAITRDNELYGWGRNYWGQLGRGYATEDKDLYLKPERITRYIPESIVQNACGQAHSLLLTLEGKVFGWGANDHGQVGCGQHLGSKISRISHIRIPEVTKLIHCAFDRSFAITATGQVYSWGYNQCFQLGHELSRNECIGEPKLIDRLKDIQTMCSSNDNSYFLSKEGVVFFCGLQRNQSNQQTHQMLPKPIKTDLTFTGLESVYSGRARSLIASAVSSQSVFHFSHDSLIETNYKTFVDFYSKDYQLTTKTIEISDVAKKNLDQLDNLHQQEHSESGDEYRRVPSVDGVFKNKFQVLSVIGSGGFGTVLKVKHVYDQQIYAIKKIEVLTEQTDKHAMDRLLAEASTLAKIRDEGVVRYMDSWIENNCLYIQMEFCSENLKDIIVSKRLAFQRRSSEAMNVIEFFLSSQLLKELLESVQYLHEFNPPIIHRDLKPQNILIAESPIRGRFLKICDFGLATVDSISSVDSMKHTKDVGTCRYMAPEVQQGTLCKSGYSTKADIYSLAIISMELFDFDVNSSDDNRDRDEFLGLQWKVLSKQIVRMLNSRHRDRPTCADLLAAHHFWTVRPKDISNDKNFKLVCDHLKSFHNNFYFNYLMSKLAI